MVLPHHCNRLCEYDFVQFEIIRSLLMQMERNVELCKGVGNQQIERSQGLRLVLLQRDKLILILRIVRKAEI